MPASEIDDIFASKGKGKSDKKTKAKSRKGGKHSKSDKRVSTTTSMITLLAILTAIISKRMNMPLLTTVTSGILLILSFKSETSQSAMDVTDPTPTRMLF